jgi:hypothetical protein
VFTDQKLSYQIVKVLAAAEIGVPEPGTIIPIFEIDRKTNPAIEKRIQGRLRAKKGMLAVAKECGHCR